MDPASAKELAAALGALAALVESLGPGGVIALAVGSPFLMVLTVSAQGVYTSRRLYKMYEEARAAVDAMWERHRVQLSERQEAHRQETAAIVRELGEGLRQTTRFYEDNVLLVKNYETLAKSLQDLIVTSISAQERMAAGLELFLKSVERK